jgi:DNA-directed RNA polymerase specialized sigma subunit
MAKANTKADERDTDQKALQEIKQELECVKRLLILHLLKLGATQQEVGDAAGVAQNTVSTWFPKGKPKKY